MLRLARTSTHTSTNRTPVAGHGVVLLLAAASLLLACTGKVGESVARPGARGGPGPEQDGDPGGTAGSGGGNGGAGGVLTCGDAEDPGTVALHRLNRAEYDNTVRDLLGDTERPGTGFPVDDSGYGFDNVAAVLTTSGLHVEMYAAAAERLVATAMYVDRATPIDVQVEAESAEQTTGGDAGDYWNLYSAGEAAQLVTLPQAGRYHVSVRAYGQQAGPDPARMTVKLLNREVASFNVTATAGSPGLYEADVDASAGPQPFAVEFVNDYYDDTVMPAADRNLLVDWFRIEGPTGLTSGPPSAQRARLVPCDPSSGPDCVRLVLGSFARSAWRRPVTPAETDRLVALAGSALAEGDDLEAGLQLAMQAVLLSPHFLYRPELDEDPASPVAHPLGDHELASRLSYFLWSSMPDDQLLAAADAGQLRDAAGIETQVRRMVQDPKAAALVDNFAGQWLALRKLEDPELVAPNREEFPDFDEELRASMAAETRRFFRSFLEEDKSALSLLDADHGYLNDRLARHYGLPPPGVASTDPAALLRVSLAGTGRAGLLGQGSFLTHTSNPTRTSPVKRGKWVLSELLCDRPDDPPPGVEGLGEPVDPTASLRVRMEQHRADPICSQCHARMDPIGFGLEGFDATGAVRTEDDGFAIDDAGTLPDGRSFEGGAELGRVIAGDPALASCLTERLLIYATGRGVELEGGERRPTDRCHVAALSERWGARGHRLTELLVLIATSEPFRMRRGVPPEVQP